MEELTISYDSEICSELTEMIRERLTKLKMLDFSVDWEEMGSGEDPEDDSEDDSEEVSEEELEEESEED